jgi:hypothetical protein
MSFGNSFLKWMNVVVTLEAFLSRDTYGDPTFDTLRYYRAFIDGTGTLFRNREGEQLVDSAAIYLHPLEVNADGSAKSGGVRLTSVHEDSRVGFPDPTQAGGTAHPVILKVDALNDETGLVLFVLHT